MAATGLLAAGCGSSSSSSSNSSGSSGGSASASVDRLDASSSSFSFGTPKKATGSPVRVRDDQRRDRRRSPSPRPARARSRPMNYVNNYLGGINGHPIQIDNCVGDGTPATAARCANELVAKHPIAILGAADVGAPASIPIYAHANLAYLGGIPFTPVPFKAPELDPVLVGQRRRQRGRRPCTPASSWASRASRSCTSTNPQGESILGSVPPVFKAAGVTDGQADPAVADLAGPEPAGGADPVERRRPRVHRRPERLRQRAEGAQERRLHRQADGHRSVQRAAGDRSLGRRRRGHVHRLAVRAPDRREPAGAAVPGRDEEVGRPRTR